MKRRSFKILFGVLAILVVAFWLSTKWFHKDHSDALWKFVSQQCVPHLKDGQPPTPCESVDLAGGYALFKDRVGPLQYLLIPTDKVTGVESPLLLDAKTPNYFADAWKARGLLAEKYGKPISDTLFSLAINSASGRTQNQLHIHMSCLKTDVMQTLANHQASFSPQWQTIDLNGHPYFVRTLTPEQLSTESIFIRWAKEHPQARDKMGDYGFAVTGLADGNLLLLVLEKQLVKGITGSAEELQDHNCPPLYPQPETHQ